MRWNRYRVAGSRRQRAGQFRVEALERRETPSPLVSADLDFGDIHVGATAVNAAIADVDATVGSIHADLTVD